MTEVYVRSFPLAPDQDDDDISDDSDVDASASASAVDDGDGEDDDEDDDDDDDDGADDVRQEERKKEDGDKKVTYEKKEQVGKMDKDEEGGIEVEEMQEQRPQRYKQDDNIGDNNVNDFELTGTEEEDPSQELHQLQLEEQEELVEELPEKTEIFEWVINSLIKVVFCWE